MPHRTPSRHEDELSLVRGAGDTDDFATDAMLEKIVDGVFLDLQDLDRPEAFSGPADAASRN